VRQVIHLPRIGYSVEVTISQRKGTDLLSDLVANTKAILHGSLGFRDLRVG